ncbi:MAG TPA: zinc-binding dehydrogenase [Candidatus Limnocylindria bacterium]|nr:zinc-binding dehydrogenase [Candidatus Limnocylindria bacterium]
MKTTALRLHGAGDLRLGTFDLPPIREDEILVKVVSDSVCMSTWKCAVQGEKHKRVPKDVAQNPVILGHEFAGDIVEVGSAHRDTFRPGMKFTLQPALNYKGSMASPGYSYPYFGGDATYCIIPSEVMELGYLLEYTGGAYFEASLAEPMSCSIGAFHACYHTQMGVYRHDMGIKAGGRMAILGGAGPMGLGAVDYALHGDRRPGVLVVTDVSPERVRRARELFPGEEARRCGVELVVADVSGVSDQAAYLRSLYPEGFDDVFVYAPVREAADAASAVLGRDGCLNFFAGPQQPDFRGELNYYDVHYNATHVLGTTGGNLDDMKEALALSRDGRITPAVMVTHIGGLDCAADTVLRLPDIPGGKKLVYTHIRMPLTAIADFGALAGEDARFGELARIVGRSRGLWSPEAERYLLAHWTA